MNCIKVPSFMNVLSNFLRESSSMVKFYSQPCPFFAVFIVYIDRDPYES